MPSATKSTLVPTINIAPFLADPASPEAEKVIAEVNDACSSTGFFQVVGHGVPKELQQATFDASKAFFALPIEEKMKLDIHKSIGHRGYDRIGTQSYTADSLPDLKEGFFTGHQVSPDDPRIAARRMFFGHNQWPSEDALPSSAFKDPVSAYYDAMAMLTRHILDIIARALSYGDRVAQVFEEFNSNSPTAPMRLLHYPKQELTAANQFGASAHTDFGAITLLLQDDNPGLEVVDPRVEEETWVGVPPQRDAYVVNVGDMLSLWTKGRYKSSMHRVLNVGGKDRYSIVYFYDGNLDCKLDPLDGTPAVGKSITVEQHLIKRMTESYGPK